MKQLLLELGIDIKLLVAGFCGGVVHTFVFKQTDPYTAVGSIIAGVFTSNYVGMAAARMLNISEPFAGFAVGLSAMAVCQGIVAAAKQFKYTRPADGSGEPK